ncbi:MAG: hypothetical protein CM1200mP24_03790 [Gammaproteobacteria bacterium]|nr:MAG: hypothetical protein CM1200mP24_03790 [Gammaproteobacteria bacterium]
MPEFFFPGDVKWENIIFVAKAWILLYSGVYKRITKVVTTLVNLVYFFGGKSRRACPTIIRKPKSFGYWMPRHTDTVTYTMREHCRSSVSGVHTQNTGKTPRLLRNKYSRAPTGT